MVRGGRGFKDHLLPRPLTCAGTCSCLSLPTRWAEFPLLWFLYQLSFLQGCRWFIQNSFTGGSSLLKPIFLPFSSRQLMVENVKLGWQIVTPVSPCPPITQTLSLQTKNTLLRVVAMWSVSWSNFSFPHLNPIVQQNFVTHESEITFRYFIPRCL